MIRTEEITCTTCGGPVSITLVNVEQSMEEDGVEVNYQCPWCRREHYAVIPAADFRSVD